MPRRRAGGPIRVLDRCARCGSRYLPLYAGRRVVAHLPIGGRPVRHELMVCRGCDGQTEPTRMEAAAMALDATNPIDVQRFMWHWSQALDRVQRTAELFLGSDVYFRERLRLRDLQEAEEAREERYAEAARQRYLDAGGGGVGEDDDWREADDDLPF